MTEIEAQEFLDSASAKLSEHFGAVQIVTSRLMPNGSTACTMSGRGDWYARRALCQEFVERDQADIIARKINDGEKPESGEDWKAT